MKHTAFLLFLCMALCYAVSLAKEPEAKWSNGDSINVLGHGYYCEIRYGPNDLDTIVGHKLGDIYVVSVAKDSMIFETGCCELNCAMTYHFKRRDMHLEQCNYGENRDKRQWILCAGNRFSACYHEYLCKTGEDRDSLQAP